MAEAFIQSELLNWAVERSKRSLQAVARSADIPPEKLEEWKKGESLPTFRQAQNLANALRIPFGYLFLSSIPEERVPLPDLRTVRNAGYEEFSLDFLDLVNDALRKQQWYREYLLGEGATALDFVGKFNVNDKPVEIADDIRDTLGITDKLREDVNSWEEFLTEFIKRAESRRILVLQSGIVGSNNNRKLLVEEFRGFTICDDIAPLIFINGRDFKVAKIFTLAHELAHIWIGQSGVSNVAIGEVKPMIEVAIEYFCNEVAAEVLVPKDRFLLKWQRHKNLESNVHSLSYYFRVSAVVILRRAYDLGIITADEYFNSYHEELEHQQERIEKKIDSSGGNFYSTLFARNSKLLTSTIIATAFEGSLPYYDAAKLLGVKVKTLEKIANRLDIR